MPLVVYCCFILEILTFSDRILALEKLGAVFNQVSTPLQYTPRKFVIHPESGNLVIIETDHNAYTEESKQLRKQTMAEVCYFTSVMLLYVRDIILHS